MDPKAIILDISSDEEVGWGETKGNCGGEDYDWISELLDEVDGGMDDSDDVVLVGEVVANPKQRMKSLSAASKEDVDVDDDCAILDGDPDKPFAIENDSASDSDDLLVVGEKGQIACRDYPHPRHLCAKFPFTSTPHERHCEQCHCYVCDSLAPCFHWGTGISSTDHCHATEKDEFWKGARNSSKKSDKFPQPVPKVPDISLAMGLPPRNQVRPLIPLEANSVPQNQISRSTSVHTCSASTNFDIPNIINQGRSQRSGYVVPRNKFQPYLTSQQLLNPCNNNAIQRDRRHNSVGSLGPQFVSPHVFKRAGHHSGYCSSNNNCGSQHSRNPPLVAIPNARNPNRWPEFHGGRRRTPESNTYWSSSQPSNDSINPKSVPSQPNLSSQPDGGSIFANPVLSQPQGSSQPKVGSFFANPVPSQSQVSSQPNVGGIFANSVPCQSQVSSQPCVTSMFASSVRSQLQVSPQTNVSSNFGNSMPSQPQLSSQTNLCSAFANSMPSQPQVYSPTISVPNDTQNVFQQGNQTQSALDPSFTDFDLSWDTHAGQISQQPVAENSRHQIIPQTDESSSLVTGFNSQFPGNTNPGSLDFQFDSWILEDQLVSGALVSVPPAVNELSPEPAPLDAGFLFDF